MKQSVVATIAASIALVAGLFVSVPTASADVVTGIDGTVTVDGGVGWTGNMLVLTERADGAWASIPTARVDPVTGQYAVNAPPGTYILHFQYRGNDNLASSFYGGTSKSVAIPVVVPEGARIPAIDQVLYPGAVITGTVTGQGGAMVPKPGVYSWYLSADSSALPRRVIDPVTGAFRIDKLAEGQVILQLSGGEGWFTQYWGGTVPTGPGQPITVPRSGIVSGIDSPLQPAPVISGQLALTSGLPAPRVDIQLHNALGETVDHGSTDAQGHYFFNVRRPGTYYVCVPAGSFASGCWGDSSTPDAAAPIVVSGVTGEREADFVIYARSSIAGTVTGQMNSSVPPVPVAARLEVYEEVPSAPGTYWAPRVAEADGLGTFNIWWIRPGNYLIRASDANGVFDSQWWDAGQFRADAQVIQVEEGSSTSLDIKLTADGPEVRRLGGDSRYSTGVKVSKFAHPEVHPNLPVVYIASGANFPDALSAGPAASHQDGALLLVAPDSIPAEVRAELVRLSPERIVVVGSEDSVGESVFDQLTELVGDPDDVIRLGGSNRYATSAMIARYAFTGTNQDSTAFITNGGNFPDALSAGPAAAHLNGPVILVDGAATTPSAAAIDLIDDLDLGDLVIVGGAPGMNQSQASAITSQTGLPTSRIAGVDRYDTSLRLAEYSGEGEWMFLATGLTFADALVGGPAAFAYGAPLILSPGDCVVRGTLDFVKRTDVQGVVVLGGTPSLSDRVANLIPCG